MSRLPARPLASLELGREAGLPDAVLGRAGSVFSIGRAAGGWIRAGAPKTSIGSGVGRAVGDAVIAALNIESVLWRPDLTAIQ